MRGMMIFILVSTLVACTTTTNLAGVPEQKPASKAPPENRARVHTELAALYYQQGSFKTALAEIDMALRIDPAYAQAYDMRGLVNMQLGENSQAADSFKQAIDLAPKDPDIRNNYGWFLCVTGRPKDGLKQLEQAWAKPLYDTPGKALANASRCAAMSGDSAQAKIYSERAAKYGETVSSTSFPDSNTLDLSKTQ